MLFIISRHSLESSETHKKMPTAEKTEQLILQTNKGKLERKKRKKKKKEDRGNGNTDDDNANHLL